MGNLSFRQVQLQFNSRLGITVNDRYCAQVHNPAHPPKFLFFFNILFFLKFNHHNPVLCFKIPIANFSSPGRNSGRLGHP